MSQVTYRIDVKVEREGTIFDATYYHIDDIDEKGAAEQATTNALASVFRRMRRRFPEIEAKAGA